MAEGVFAATIASSAQVTLVSDALISPGTRVVLEGIAPRDFVLRYVFWRCTSEEERDGRIVSTVEGTKTGTDVVDFSTNLDDEMVISEGALVHLECTLVAPAPRRVTCILQGEPVRLLHAPRAELAPDMRKRRAALYASALVSALGDEQAFGVEADIGAARVLAESILANLTEE